MTDESNQSDVTLNGINWGVVPVFKWEAPSKEQAVKVVEEAAEVFGAFQQLAQISVAINNEGIDISDEANVEYLNTINENTADLLDECCDLIQATTNLIHTINPDIVDMRACIEDCANRNIKRGRSYEVVEETTS